MRNFPRFFPARISVALLMISYALWRFSIREISKQPVTKSSCEDYFHNESYNFKYGLIKTILIGETHGVNEHYVADCLETIATAGDHLLIESPTEGKETSCDDVHSAYKRFNGKLKCYGFDVSMSDVSRRTYSDLIYRINFIADRSSKFFIGANSGKEVISRINTFADILEKYESHEIHPKYFDPTFNKRTAKYLRKLGKSMSGLNIPEMQDFLIKENNRLANKADQYREKSSRDHRFISEIISHKQLVGKKYRLFAVAGTDHTSPKLNSELREKIIQSGVPITILTPKPPK